MATNVDFGLLQGINPTNRAVGSAPPTNVGAQIGNGISQAVQNYNSAQNSALQRQNVQQQMDQRSQLFPLQLQQEKDRTAYADMALSGAKQDATDKAKLRQAAIAGPDQFGKVLQQQDPVRYQNYQLAQAKTQQAFQEVTKNNLDNEKLSLNNYNDAMSKASQVTNAALAGKSPQMQQSIYAFGYSQLPPQVQKAMDKVFPSQQFNVDQAAAVTELGKQAHASILVDQASKGNQPAVLQIQQIRDQKQQAIEQAKASGQQPNPQDLKDVQELTDAISEGNSKSKGNDKNPYDSSLAQQDAKNASNAYSTRQTVTKLMGDAKDASNQLDKIPDSQLGPVVNYFKANGLNPNKQILDKLTAEMPFLNKSLVGISQGMRFTQGELDQLNKITGSAGNYKVALKWIMDRTMAKGTEAVHEQWEKEKNIRENGSSDRYALWLKQNPEPTKSLEDPNNSYLHPNGPIGPTAPSGRVLVYGPNGEIKHVPAGTTEDQLKVDGKGFSLSPPKRK